MTNVLDLNALRGRPRYAGLVDPKALASTMPVSGLKVWYDAHTLALGDGTAISSFTDLSGNGKHLVQATGSLQPVQKVNIVNGRSIVRFDGSDDYLSVSNTTAGGYTSYTILTVLAPTGTEGTEGLFQWASGLSSGTPFILIQRNSGDVRWYTTSIGYAFTTAQSAGTFALNIFTWDGTTHTLYVNNGAGNTANGGRASEGGELYMGNGYSGYPACDWSELAIWNRVLSAGELAYVKGLMNAKYALW